MNLENKKFYNTKRDYKNEIQNKLYFAYKIIVFWRIIEYNAFILFKGNLWERR